MGRVKRGATGAILSMQSIGKVTRYFEIDEAALAAMARQAQQQPFGSAPSVPVIDSIAPLMPAKGLLLPGDVLYKIKGQVVAQDILTYDFLIDDAVGSSVDLVVLRKGKQVPVRVPVKDLESQKPMKSVQPFHPSIQPSFRFVRSYPLTPAHARSCLWRDPLESNRRTDLGQPRQAAQATEGAIWSLTQARTHVVVGVVVVMQVRAGGLGRLPRARFCHPRGICRGPDRRVVRIRSGLCSRARFRV